MLFIPSVNATYIIEARRGKMGLRTYANSKAFGKPAHPRSLARSFTVCLTFYQGKLFANSKTVTSGETLQMRRLAGSFAVYFELYQDLLFVKANSKASETARMHTLT